MKETNVTIAMNYPRETKFLRAILVITLLLFSVGLVAPIITLNKFVFLQSTFSVLSGSLELLKEGKILLFILITGFSIVLPLLKLGVLYKILSAGVKESVSLEKYLHLMHLYGKWSMLDVFVVAVLVVVVKFGVFANVDVRYGLYSFAMAVILTMYITSRVVKLSKIKSVSPAP